MGNDFYLSGKVVYSYSTTGNLASIVIHDLDQSGKETFAANTLFSKYDSKNNPVHLDNEAFVLGQPDWISPNNISSEQLSDSNGPVDNQTATYTYTYNANDKPAASIVTIMPDNTVIYYTYYYQ